MFCFLLADCTIWKPIPPSSDYVALGFIVTPDHNPPSLDVIRCFKKDYLNQSKHCNLSKKHPFLWRSPTNNSTSIPSTLWLVQPRLDSLWCNIFCCVKGTNPPDTSLTHCLKLLAAS